MEGISQHLRLQGLKMVGALLGAAVVAMVMSASASAVYNANDISIRIVDNTPHHSASVALCPTGHASFSYPFGTVADPCNRITETHFIGANGGRYPAGAWPGTTYTANPLGVVVKLSGEADRPLYFYAKNPTLGLPFFEASRGPATCSVLNPCTHQKVKLVQGELQTRTVGGVVVRFHREGDLSVGPNAFQAVTYKVMTIEICGASTANCR